MLKVVFNLFQDLEGFSLVEYQPFTDVSTSIDKILQFYRLALQQKQHDLVPAGTDYWNHIDKSGTVLERFTTNRDIASQSENIALIGLDHPDIAKELATWRNCPPEKLGLRIKMTVQESAILTSWEVEIIASQGERKVKVIPVTLNLQGIRQPALERRIDEVFSAEVSNSSIDLEKEKFLKEHIEPALFRELKLRNGTQEGVSYATKLIAWVEIHS